MKASACLLAVTAAGHALARPPSNASRADAVRKAFQTAWDGYYKYAFPHDHLLPTSKLYVDDRGGWGLTPIDSLDTAIVMNNTVVVNRIIDFVPTIDFTTTKWPGLTISVFETTIRYMGGLLSAYDLLKGPYNHLVNDEKKVDVLLKQATSLADSLAIAFSTPSGLADGYLILNPRPMISGADRSSLAEVGTLVLEWTRLSDLTGNQTYAELAQKCQSYLLEPKGSPEPWPGLTGNIISTLDGTFLNSDGGWSGGTDSFYEYLIKMYLYDPTAFGQYRDRWIAAADSTMKHLASSPTSREDLTFVAQYSGQNTEAVTGHLTSFIGGNFILAGLLLNEDKYTQFGIKLTESYFSTYTATASDIGPETFRWVDSKLTQLQRKPPKHEAKFYARNGFWIENANYVLRPETVESLYYAYRATGDARYQDWAWRAFKAIAGKCRAGAGFSGLKDVTEQVVMKQSIDRFDDFQQSFFLAETLKYLYLIFAQDSPVQVQRPGAGPNEFVFNTEAHPLRVRRKIEDAKAQEMK